MDEINELEIFDELDAKCKELTNGKFNLEDLVDTLRTYEDQQQEHGKSRTRTKRCYCTCYNPDNENYTFSINY